MTGPLAEGAAFVDTNIVVYAYDEQAGPKHLRARALLAELSGADRSLRDSTARREAANNAGHLDSTQQAPTPRAGR